MALALPLAILDSAGTASSIARFTTGNATPPKNLVALGVAEGQTAPYAISNWVGCEDANVVSVCCYSIIGSDFSCCSCKFSCLVYNPALGASQTWCACFCWRAYVGTGGSGDRACQCVRIVCNGINKMNCYVTSVGGGYQNCLGSVVFGPIDSNDTVCLITCSTGFFGGSYGYARGDISVYCSFGNLGGNVALSSTFSQRCVCSIAITN